MQCISERSVFISHDMTVDLLNIHGQIRNAVVHYRLEYRSLDVKKMAESFRHFDKVFLMSIYIANSSLTEKTIMTFRYSSTASQILCIDFMIKLAICTQK